MPDHRKHRGPHPEDTELFRSQDVPGLWQAMRDLSWLLTRGYATPSALKLVGDRYALNARQRLAVGRCACSDAAVGRRQQHEVHAIDLRERELWIDGYNVLTSVEAALAGGVLLHARDGCYRDMASMHGSYRKVEETAPAIQLLGDALAAWGVATSVWLLDRPVSNSGRLKTMLGEIAAERGWHWQIDLVPDPDKVLIECDQIVASADSQILDQAQRWFNLARTVIESQIPNHWVVELTDESASAD